MPRHDFPHRDEAVPELERPVAGLGSERPCHGLGGVQAAPGLAPGRRPVAVGEAGATASGQVGPEAGLWVVAGPLALVAGAVVVVQAGLGPDGAGYAIGGFH